MEAAAASMQLECDELLCFNVTPQDFDLLELIRPRSPPKKAIAKTTPRQRRIESDSRRLARNNWTVDETGKKRHYRNIHGDRATSLTQVFWYLQPVAAEDDIVKLLLMI